MQSNEMWLIRNDNEELGSPQRIINTLKTILPQLIITPPNNKYKKILEAKKVGLTAIQIECIKNSPPEYEGYYENQFFKFGVFIRDLKIVPSILVFIDPIESEESNMLLNEIEIIFDGKLENRSINP